MTTVWREDWHTGWTGGIPRRSSAEPVSTTASVRFDILSRERQVVDSLWADRDAVPTIEWDPRARIPRVLSGVAVDGVEIDRMDFHRDLVRPMWVTPGGERPLGVFMWAHAEIKRRPGGRATDRLEGGVAYDQTKMFDVPLEESFVVDPEVDNPNGNSDAGMPHVGNLLDAIVNLAVRAGFDLRYAVLPGYTRIPRTHIGWPAGTPIRRCLRDVCYQAGWVHWFDRNGIWHVGRLPTPELDGATVRYRTGDSVWGILADTAEDVKELERRPNVWRVIDVAPKRDEITASYELPTWSPGSAANVGQRRPRVIEAQGLANSDEAEELLIEEIRADWRREDKVTFNTRPNPDHDAWTIVEWLGGERFLEEYYRMELSPTGVHEHRLRRVSFLLPEGAVPN